MTLQHWRFRLEDPKIALSPVHFCQVDTSNAMILSLGDEASCSLSDGAVFIAKTPLECFVIVTPSARGDAMNIARALKAAQVLVNRQSTQSMPFRPTIHALVLPSLIPKDLQASLRSTILEDLVSSPSCKTIVLGLRCFFSLTTL